MPRGEKTGDIGSRKNAIDKPEDTYSIWDSPGVVFDTQWGRLNYRQWCKKEAQRLAKKGKLVRIRTASDGEIALEDIKEDEND